MSPTAEQLIRDYLNQISVAARTRLRSDQRRAFLARMRDAIERNCGAPGTADPAEVARVLASLGDPQRLVDLESARLAAGQQEVTARPWGAGPRLSRPQGRAERRDGAGNPRPGLSSGLAGATGARSKPGSASRTGMQDEQSLTGEIKIVNRPITARWRPGEPLQPRQPPSQRQERPSRIRLVPRGRRDSQPAGPADAQAQQAGTGSAQPGPAAGAPAAARPDASAAAGGGPASRASGSGQSEPGGGPGTPADGSGQPGRPTGQLGSSDGGPQPGRSGSPAGPRPPADERTVPGGGEPAVLPLPAQQTGLGRSGLPARQAGLRSGLAGVVTGAARGLTGGLRRNPLEGTAVLVLILAGLIYPVPVGLFGFVLWLAGILLALPSRLWDARDKLTGLGAPMIVAVIGTAIALAVGGSHRSVQPYLHEIATAGPPLLRAAVALGALYLGWRIRRGPRAPTVPPWNRPHRI